MYLDEFASVTPSGSTIIVGVDGGVDCNFTVADLFVSPALTGTPTVPTAAPGTNTTQAASTAFVTAAIGTAVTGLLDLKGSTDCSSNPNYPAASKGDAYLVSVAGKIGGASGKSVDASDMYVATADNAGGTEASVGTSWTVLEHNLTGALLSANNLSDLASAATARTNLGLVINTDVQAYDADLAAIAGLTPSNDDIVQRKAGAWTNRTIAQLIADLATGGLSSTVTGANVLINGGFDIFARQTPATLTERSDDTYGPDRWYVLSQTAAIQCQRGTGSTSTYSGLIKQHQASGQRMGIAQIVEGVNSRPLRSQAVVFQGKLKCSSSQAIRFAILEWTGTEDAVTSDVVNDWTSGTYTAGNFFNATTLTVTAVGTITPSAATWTAFNLTATLGASTNNAILVVWTEGTAAQNVTLELSECDFFAGAAARTWNPRPPALETLLCRRYCHPIADPANADGIGYLSGARAATTRVDAYVNLTIPMRITPTLVHSSPAWGTAAASGNQVAAFDKVAGSYVTITGALTPTILGNGAHRFVLRFTAGTSFSGTMGSKCDVSIGDTSGIVLDAEL